MSIAPVSLSKLNLVFSNQERHGVRYGLGAKIPLTADSHDPRYDICDCSGESRYLLYKATDGALVIPDGSQNQREWCENNGLHQLAHYSDVVYADASRLFIAFIKPFENNCGPVGHVWLVHRHLNGEPPTTLESHGGAGIDSRVWNSRTLIREVYSCFELPTCA